MTATATAPDYQPAETGDIFDAPGGTARVTRCSRTGAWVDITVTQPTGASWSKRMPNGIPADWRKQEAPTKRGAASDPAGPRAVGTAPESAPVTGRRAPDAAPQVSPSRTRTGEDGEPGASDAPAGPPVAGPGVHHDLPEAEYFAHPALSASGAKRLLPPSCPALFAWEREHGRPPKKEFDYGHAAHQLVLGVGRGLAPVDAPDWRTKVAKEAQDAARAEGKIPLLAKQVLQVEAMAAALREHPLAAPLLDPDRGGRPEVSLVWHDPTHDVDRRCRVDWLREPVNGRLILVDYKTTTCAARGAIEKSVREYRYDLSGAWYRDLIVELDLAEDVPVVLIFQEKSAPYLVNVVQLDEEWLSIGRVDADRALQVFRECTDTGTWPSYSSDVELITPPAWLARQYEGADA